jgi:hypothetical protein
MEANAVEAEGSHTLDLGAQNTRGDVGALVADEQTFGSLGRCPRFAAAIRRDVHDLATCDPRDVIDTRLAQAAPVLLA